MEAVLVAAFGSLTAIASAYAAYFTRNIDKKTKTNHGKTAGEYLEMILDVRESQLDLAEAQVELKEALIEHTRQDAARFGELTDLIRELL